MGKRKTRKEKKRHDLRKQIPHQTMHAQSTSNEYFQNQNIHSFTLSSFEEKHQTHISTYNFHDIYKTLLVTALLIGSEILLFFLIQSHILSIPGIGNK